ncbi:RAD50-interacting protein 1, partial [Operophtera brumata]
MSEIKLDDDTKKKIAGEINLRIGSDINDLSSADDLATEFIRKKNHIQSCLATAQSEVPKLISTAIKKAEVNSHEIDSLKTRSESLKEKVDLFLERTNPLSEGLEKRFYAINKLDKVLQYLKSFEKIDELRHYEDVVKQLKWPLTSPAEPLPKEVIVKFYQEPCLPVKILLRPLKKRFAFHFTGSRQTARIDRPEWFLTQTLTWIKVHQEFIRKHVQSVANKLELKNRLHIVLGSYSQGGKGEPLDLDAAFAHAVDETLGFSRELTALTGRDVNSVLSVLTRAETMLSEPVAGGATSAVGALLWVPRSADWFITLLKTIEERYAMLPQPGHRLQFLELQLEMIEEWRIRLTQLLSAATESLTVDSFMNMGSSSGPHPLIAVVNAAHHTHTVLLQWAHSLTRPIANLAVAEHLDGDHEAEEAGVFLDAPALLAHLRDSGLTSLADHIVLEFKAGLRDYKRQKLCEALTMTEVVVENWFNVGGSMQLSHDYEDARRLRADIVKHPATAEDSLRSIEITHIPPTTALVILSHRNDLCDAPSPTLLQACKRLNLEYEDARRLRTDIVKHPATAEDSLRSIEITHIPATTAL